MGDAAGAERRKFPRFQKRLMIKTRNLSGSAEPEYKRKACSVLNISKNGILVRSRESYAIENVLELSFPDSAVGKARTVHGRIIWLAPSPDLGGYILGIKFVKAPTRQEAVPTGAGGNRSESEWVPLDTSKRLNGRTGDEDRRTYPRWRQGVMVKYRCVSEGYLHDPDDRVGKLEDFGRGGLSLSVSKEYATGNLFEVKLPGSVPHVEKARVVWIGSDEKPGRWRVGVQFVRETF